MEKNNKNKNDMSAKILNIYEGLIEYENVKYIRIKSKYYNLMIMKDYLPIIGEIDGDVKFELVNDTIRLNNIKGYFMNKHNQFNLFIKYKFEDKQEEKTQVKPKKIENKTLENREEIEEQIDKDLENLDDNKQTSKDVYTDSREEQ